ncbi:MAG: hypothetical protein PHR39_00890 [Actinomycetota bacterium]|jgi:hypothetical protein|nr:hypothetical protein [Actinomycetota bacterium]
MNDVQKQGASGLSIAALVTGILGLAIIPIILAAIELNKIKKGLSSPAGKGMSIAGLILGILALIGWIIYAIVASVLLAGFANAMSSIS